MKCNRRTIHLALEKRGKREILGDNSHTPLKVWNKKSEDIGNLIEKSRKKETGFGKKEINMVSGYKRRPSG